MAENVDLLWRMLTYCYSENVDILWLWKCWLIVTLKMLIFCDPENVDLLWLWKWWIIAGGGDAGSGVSGLDIFPLQDPHFYQWQSSK